MAMDSVRHICQRRPRILADAEPVQAVQAVAATTTSHRVQVSINVNEREMSPARSR